MTHDPSPPTERTARDEAALAEHALAKDGVEETAPWGHRAFRVRKKNFLFMTSTGEGLSLSLKLGPSHADAMEKTFVEPTGYGLGKSGWVSARFGPREAAPLPLLRAWIDESYALFTAKTPRSRTPSKKTAAAKRPAKTTASTRKPRRP